MAVTGLYVSGILLTMVLIQRYLLWELYSIVINAITESEKPVLAIDVPSGLDAATGDIMGTCIKVGKTVTFGLPKSGFIKKHGPSKTGEVITADISIPWQLLK
jgi:NAD(P)H-hydrate repair Nnr-like enzyme with NAD(P)H-hydrate epimerase domain